MAVITHYSSLNIIPFQFKFLASEDYSNPAQFYLTADIHNLYSKSGEKKKLPMYKLFSVFHFLVSCVYVCLHAVFGV